MTNLTPVDQFIVSAITRYPTLYGATSLKTAKLKVLDHTLNVVGNGVRDDEELAEYLTVTSGLTMADAERFINETGVMYGYTEANIKRRSFTNDKGETHEFTFGNGDPEDFYITKEEEKANHPEIVYWVTSEHHGFTPYPNFQEDYSTMFQAPSFMDLDVSWLEAALWFYKECQLWFVDNESQYHYAFPEANAKATERRTAEMQQYLKSDKYKTNEDISKAYECEFVGSVDNAQDVHNFQVARWAIEKARIDTFLTSTINLLETKLKERADATTN